MKNRILIFFLLLFFQNFSFPQKINRPENLHIKILEKDSIIDLLKNKIDSIKSEPNYLNHSGTISIESDSSKGSTIFEFLFPSLIALSVALIALFGTIYNTKRQRKSAEKQLDKQIKSSKEILEKQIESAKINAELEFRQNVLSKNRQQWINDLRNIVSETISLTEMNALNKKVSQEDYKKIGQLISKAELMVNPNKDSDFLKTLHNFHKSLINVAQDKEDYSEFYNFKRELLKETKTILKTEWERVKKGE